MNAPGKSPRSQIKTLFSSHLLGIPIPKAVSQKKEEEKKVTKRGTSSKKIQKKPVQEMEKAKPYKKKKITGALREAVWIKTMGKKFEGKCPVTWCPNTITVFDFQSGHNIPESKGGSTTLPNLIAICARCNFSMGNHHTIDEWNTMHAPGTQPILTPNVEIKITHPKQSWIKKFMCCFFRRAK